MSVYLSESSNNLYEAINSMIKQTVKPEQIVIVKDGPLSDELNGVIDLFNVNNPGIFTIVPIKNNVGLGKALNEGLKYCRNDLVARMDSDDISFHDRCEKQLKAFEVNKNLTLIGGYVLEFEGKIDNIISSRVVPTKYDDILKFSKKRSPFNHPTVMYKKSIVEGVGGYPEFPRKQDLGLFLKMLSKKYYAINLDEPVLFYRTSKDNLKRRTTWNNCKTYIEIMYGFYKEKYINAFDLFFVIISQLSMFILPNFIVDKISKFFLRK